MNAEFQRTARRDKKAFLSDQCKEKEENNRMGKTRDLFRKTGDIKETFCPKWVLREQMSEASVRNSAHGKGHEEGGFGIHKGRIELQETPCSRASTPKTRVCLLYFYALTYTSDFTGCSPPSPFLSEKELTCSSS